MNSVVQLDMEIWGSSHPSTPLSFVSLTRTELGESFKSYINVNHKYN